jgi:hypothetical protein
MTAGINSDTRSDTQGGGGVWVQFLIPAALVYISGLFCCLTVTAFWEKIPLQKVVSSAGSFCRGSGDDDRGFRVQPWSLNHTTRPDPTRPDPRSLWSSVFFLVM